MSSMENILIRPKKKTVLNKDIIPLEELLFLDNIYIPEYQRPYKWTIINVIQLLNDITAHKNSQAYRIGTIVFHREKDKTGLEKLNIVDGQQRLYTLSLIALALQQNENTREDTAKIIRDKGVLSMLKLPVKHIVSRDNLAINFKEIQREVAKFDADAIRFFFKSCEVVTIALNTVSEAFQFFDSQNARGKDLEPHDLLKAFHLREMKEIPSSRKQDIISIWEGADEDKKLAPLFAENLFRVKAWCRHKSGRYFGKNDNYLFKGIQISSDQSFPYSKAYTMNHFFIEEYNGYPHRAIDNRVLEFPFQLDQPIINGQRFFDMVGHYSKLMDLIVATEDKDTLEKDDIFFVPKKPKSNIFKILNALATYDKRTRQGDRYVRTLFNNALLYYIDKFGVEMLEENIVKLFVWSYSLRLNMQAVKLASMDNYTREGIRLFTIIREATSPVEIQRIYLSKIAISEIKGTGLGTTIQESPNKRIYNPIQNEGTLIHLFQNFQYIS